MAQYETKFAPEQEAWAVVGKKAAKVRVNKVKIAVTTLEYRVHYEVSCDRPGEPTIHMIVWEEDIYPDKAQLLESL